MKKIISTVVFLLIFATSYGQETKPTKQETMDWIAGKFKDYINSEGSTYNTASTTFIVSYKFVSYSKNKITLMKISNNSRTNESTSTYFILNLDKITKAERYSNTETFKLKGSAEMVCWSNGRCESDFNLVSDWNNGGWSGYDRIIKLDNEPELLSRFSNAIVALIEYNKSERPKEAY